MQENTYDCNLGDIVFATWRFQDIYKQTKEILETWKSKIPEYYTPLNTPLRSDFSKIQNKVLWNQLYPSLNRVYLSACTKVMFQMVDKARNVIHLCFMWGS